MLCSYEGWIVTNYAKDNKNKFMFAYWSLLVAKGTIKEVIVTFILVGHMYDDIDTSFGQWSKKLYEEVLQQSRS